jgi:hypothetical protein
MLTTVLTNPLLKCQRRTFNWYHADGLTPAGNMSRKIQQVPNSSRTPIELILSGSAPQRRTEHCQIALTELSP